MTYGSYALTVKQAWAKRDHPNMHFVFYEDLKANTEEELKKNNAHIGANLSDQQIKNVKLSVKFLQK